MDDCVSALLCQENKTCLEEELVDGDSFVRLDDDSVSEDEYVGILMEREIAFGFKRNEPLMFRNWHELARLDAISWILKTRATFGFQFQTAYLSVTYLDRFLSRRSIDSEKYWAIRLLSVACLSLAAKMEECNVPALSEFQLQEYSFESHVIQRMELLVLSTLEWNMGLITPFAFLPYFIKNFYSKSPPTHISLTTMQLIFTIMKEVNLMDHRPSVIAAAATLVVLDQQLTREAAQLRMSSVPHYRFLETDEICACYNLFRTLYTEKTRRDKFVHFLNPSHIQSRSIHMLESSLATSAASSKRRRLNGHEEKGTHDRKAVHPGK